MRGQAETLESPHRLGDRLPAIYQETDFAMRFLAAFDQVLAPLISTLDCLVAYVDPLVAPADFLTWLASWSGLNVEHMAADDRKRLLVQTAVGLYRKRGTAQALSELIEAFTGVTPVVEESGGAAWSTAAGSSAPGSSVGQVKISIVANGDGPIDAVHLERLLRQAIPAHIHYELEIAAR